MADASALQDVGSRSKPSFILATVTVELFTDLFLYTLVVPVIPFLLRDRLGSAIPDVQSQTSNLLATYSVAAVLFSVPSGWTADRLGVRKPPLYLGSVLQVVGTIMFTAGQTFGVLLLSKVLFGVGAAIVWSIGLAMIQDTIDPQQIGQALGTVLSITTLSELVAPPIGGVLYEASGMRALAGVSFALIGINLIMLLVLVERNKSSAVTSNLHQRDGEAISEAEQQQQTQVHESSPLLGKNDGPERHTDTVVSKALHIFPVLYCFGEIRFLMGMFLSVVQGAMIGLFDATVPTEASALFQFSSLKAGLLYTALIFPYIGLSPIAGMAVDKYGTKLASTVGYGLFTVSLALLGLPEQRLLSGVPNLILFIVVLGLNGCGLALVASPAFIEAIQAAAKYEAAHPGIFGEKGPYAQVLGFNSVFMFAGLALGPLLGGVLRRSFGFGIMGSAFAGIAAVTAFLSYLLVGEKASGSSAEAED